MSIRFTTRQLDAFIAVAELSNFTLAAERLNLTPPAVSNLISELEASLGFALFQRTTRKVLVTPDGHEFLPAAIRVQRQMGLAAQAAADVRNRSADIVGIAAPLAISAMILPPIIASFRRIHPRVQVRILDTGVEWLIDRVARGEADLALGPDRVVGSEVIREALFPSPWVVWCTQGHPLSHRERVAWRDLVGYDFYAAGRDHEHSVYPKLLDHSDAAAIIPVQIVDNALTAFGIVSAGLGITCTPAYTSDLAKTFGLIMRPLVDPEVMRHMSLYSPSRLNLSKNALHFMAYLRQQLSSQDMGAAVDVTQISNGSIGAPGARKERVTIQSARSAT